MCSFVLPYLSKQEAEKLIADVAGILNKNGVLYLSTMEDDYSKSGIHTAASGNQLYMYYHENGYLTHALEASGFHIIDRRRQDAIGTDVKMTDLVIVAHLQ